MTAAFEKAGHGCFIYSVVRDMMHVYYGKFSNPAEEALYEQLYASPHEAYVYGPLPAGCDALMIAALETDEACPGRCAPPLRRCRKRNICASARFWRGDIRDIRGWKF